MLTPTLKSPLLAAVFFATTPTACTFLQPKPRAAPQPPPRNAAIEAREVEERRQQACRAEYYEIRARQRRAEEEKAAAAQAEAERAAKAACNGSGLPAGTYKVTGWLSMEISVDEEGCAAWWAVNATNISSTRTLRDQHGYYEREYTNQYYCKELGVGKVTDRGVIAGQTGQEFQCVGYLLSRDDPWKVVKRGAPAIMVRTSPSYGSEWVRVPRTSEMSNDDLYATARGGSYATSVLFAQSDRSRGANIDAMYNDYLYDYCAALAEESASARPQEPTPATP